MVKFADDVATLRGFNRVYTSRLGLLDAHYDGSEFTLSEARILYEVANGQDVTGAGIARALNLDPAQVSRSLKRFAAKRLVAAHKDPEHGRRQTLTLTGEGRKAFAALEANTRERVGGLLDSLSPVQRSRLLSAASEIVDVFAAAAEPELVLRPLLPGDLGQVVARQSILYAEEYGWNADYEALAARILADFHDRFDATRDDAWIAEIDGCMVGSIFLMRGDAPEVGKLRLLYVEPDARGLGVGRELVDACVERARELGYARLDLWTNSVLTAARRLYERAGFTLVNEAPHRSFGKDLVGQTWSLDLEPST